MPAADSLSIQVVKHHCAMRKVLRAFRFNRDSKLKNRRALAHCSQQQQLLQLDRWHGSVKDAQRRRRLRQKAEAHWADAHSDKSFATLSARVLEARKSRLLNTLAAAHRCATLRRSSFEGWHAAFVTEIAAAEAERQRVEQMRSKLAEEKLDRNFDGWKAVWEEARRAKEEQRAVDKLLEDPETLRKFKRIKLKQALYKWYDYYEYRAEKNQKKERAKKLFRRRVTRDAFYAWLDKIEAERKMGKFLRRWRRQNQSLFFDRWMAFVDAAVYERRDAGRKRVSPRQLAEQRTKEFRAVNARMVAMKAGGRVTIYKHTKDMHRSNECTLRVIYEPSTEGAPSVARLLVSYPKAGAKAADRLPGVAGRIETRLTKELEFSDVQRVAFGPVSPHFKKYLFKRGKSELKDSEWRCFSLVLQPQERLSAMAQANGFGGRDTLDFAAHDDASMKVWFLGLQAFCTDPGLPIVAPSALMWKTVQTKIRVAAAHQGVSVSQYLAEAFIRTAAQLEQGARATAALTLQRLCRMHLVRLFGPDGAYAVNQAAAALATFPTQVRRVFEAAISAKSALSPGSRTRVAQIASRAELVRQLDLAAAHCPTDEDTRTMLRMAQALESRTGGARRGGEQIDLQQFFETMVPSEETSWEDDNMAARYIHERILPAVSEFLK